MVTHVTTTVVNVIYVVRLTEPKFPSCLSSGRIRSKVSKVCGFTDNVVEEEVSVVNVHETRV